MSELTKLIQAKVDAEIETEFIAFSSKLLGIEGIPSKLKPKLFAFLQDQKHLFYSEYATRIEKLLIKIKQQDLAKTDDFNVTRDRLFLERYFEYGENAQAAAKSLSIPKSTYHDWLTKNVELIEAERNKT